VTVIRQLHYSLHNENSIDLVLFVNGLPDILLPGELEPAVALKPVFDLVWQGAGIERSYNYDEAGRWAPRR
jgi:hypothetical protein